MKLGLRIAYFRKMRGLTQEQLAEKLGKSAGYIGAVEAVNVERAISLDMLFDIADLLGVPAHKFLQFDDGENE
ncbi:MAG: helix-turn-helix transcriptional regulator [Clostridiales bacterium]|nr:helix-turn-helix transcriptional regulator [Clostridiales bacterium]